jgi:hypothetical protein
MILLWFELIAWNQNPFVSQSTDINIAPADVNVIAWTGCFDTGEGSGRICSGFSGFTTQDPNTGIPTETDLSGGSGFGVEPLAFINNAITIVYVTSIATDPNGNPNGMMAQGMCQVNW